MWTIFLMPLAMLGFLLWTGTDKKQALTLAGSVLAVGLACVLILPGILGGGGVAQTVGLVQTFGLDVDPSALHAEKLADTHGGFHGDGESLYRFMLDGDAPALADWDELPVDAELVDRAAVLTGEGERNLLRDELDLNSLKGRWKLNVEQEADGSDAFWLNWSLCLWDEENKCFYWYQFDS